MQGPRDPQSKLRCHVQGWMKYVGYFEYCETFNGVCLPCCNISGCHLQDLPVSIVEGLELRRDVDEVVGGVLLHVVDEPRVRGQVALGGEVVCTH